MTTALISIFLLLATTVKAQRTADSPAIRAILQEEVTSWNSGDTPTYSKHFLAMGRTVIHLNTLNRLKNSELPAWNSY